MAGELESIPGFYKVKNTEARELLQPHLETDGYYLLRPSSDSKGGVLCTICVTNKSKLMNYRLVKDPRTRNYYINASTPFPSIAALISHYGTKAINTEVNTRLLHPVLPRDHTDGKSSPDDTYVTMEKPADGNEDEIPGLHLYLPKAEIDAVMQPYITMNGYYLVRPSASSEGQLTLAVSHGGKILNFKINCEGGEYYISPRRRYKTPKALLDSYRNTPIRSKKSGTDKIFLVHPIPVDHVLEQKHKKLQEDKAATRNKVSSPPPQQDALPPPWQQHMHEQYKKYYYYNPETGESLWERPKPAISLTLPSKRSRASTSASEGKMKGRPLPVVPGNTNSNPSSPARSRGGRSKDPLPSVPNRGEHLQNGVVPSMPRPKSSPSERPPLPPKEASPQPNPQQDFPCLPPKDPSPSDISSRPRMPLPSNSGTTGRSFPPLPSKDDTPKPPPSQTRSKKERKKIIEYEDIVPKSKSKPAPPLPEKEDPPLRGLPPPLPDKDLSVRSPPPLPGKEDRGPPPPLPGKEDRGPPPPLPGKEDRGPPPPLPGKEDRGPPPPLPGKEDRGPPPRLPGKEDRGPPPPLPGKEDRGPPPRLPGKEDRGPPPRLPGKEDRGPPPPLPGKESPPLPRKGPPPLPGKEDKGRPPPLPGKEVSMNNTAVPPPPPLPTVVPPLPEKESPVMNGVPPPPAPPPMMEIPSVTVVQSGVPSPPPGPGVPAPPPPPPPMAPPPSPSPVRSKRAETMSVSASSSPVLDSGSGRPFCANDLQAARTLLRKRAESASTDTREKDAGGMAGVFANAIDNRMMSIRKAVVDSDTESEFEDVDDDDWDD